MVGFQGTEGSYGHQAARQHFGTSPRPVMFKAYRSFRATLEAVQEGLVERAVLPIENSTAGSVHEVYDLLFRLNLSVVGEEILEIEHCLLGVPGASAGGPPGGALASAGAGPVQRVPRGNAARARPKPR